MSPGSRPSFTPFHPPPTHPQPNPLSTIAIDTVIVTSIESHYPHHDYHYDYHYSLTRSVHPLTLPLLRLLLLLLPVHSLATKYHKPTIQILPIYYSTWSTTTNHFPTSHCWNQILALIRPLSRCLALVPVRSALGLWRYPQGCCCLGGSNVKVKSGLSGVRINQDSL